MYPYLFGNEHIPTYGVCFLLGIIISVIYLFCFAIKKTNVPRDDLVYSTCFAVIGGIIGAKLLSILTSINVIIENNLSFREIISNGFVFYGGLLGGALGYFIYCKIYKMNFLEFTDVAVQALPLGHAIGRVGCFCSGCCFGRPTDSIIGIAFSNPLDVNCPVDVKLIPTQLIETAYCLLIFITLLIIKNMNFKKKIGIYSFVYIVSYASLRFLNEFLRYDAARGSFLFFSTSQWISLLLIIFAVATLIISKIKTKRKSI